MSERAHGHGYFLSSAFPLISTSAAPFANGYVAQGRGTLRYGLMVISGFPVAAAPKVAVIRDGPAGQVIYQIPLYGAATVQIFLDISWELENGVYVTGLAALAGVEVVGGTFCFENREPGNSPQKGAYR